MSTQTGRRCQMPSQISTSTSTPQPANSEPQEGTSIASTTGPSMMQQPSETTKASSKITFSMDRVVPSRDFKHDSQTERVPGRPRTVDSSQCCLGSTLNAWVLLKHLRIYSARVANHYLRMNFSSIPDCGSQ